MEVRETFLPVEYPQIPEGMLAVDLEAANSFRGGAAVICMIGIETYLPAEGRCLSKIATITRRDEEMELVAWFLQELTDLAEAHDHPRLLTFSGRENDIPWIEQRIEQYRIERPDPAVLRRVEHVDLKLEFYRRTHNDQISLKKLELIFGIERESSMQSRKVSFILTDIVSRERPGSSIPEKIFRYLHEDVHHLIDIYNRWAEVSFEEYRLTDTEYLRYVNSLKNTVGKLINGPGKRKPPLSRVELEAMTRYHGELSAELGKALVANTFAEFALPAPPELDTSHPEMGRIYKKHRRLKGIVLRDVNTGRYLLQGKLRKPKGALAVVRRGDQLLMIRRAEHLKRAGGYWGLPGGALEDGESPTEAAVRELWEELHLEGRSAGELGTSTSFNGEFTLHWIAVEVEDISTLNPIEEEVAEVRWVAPGHVSELEPLIPGALEGFRRFLGRKWG